MASLTLRLVKGSELTHSELDGNFTAINTEVGTKQATDATLTALAGLSGAGVVTATATDTFAMRAIGVGASTAIPDRAAADTRYALTGLASASGLTSTTAKLMGRSTTGTGALEEITLGTNLSFTGTTLNATSGSGGSTEVEIVTVAGTTYTLLLTDAGKVIETTNASSVAVTVPPNSSVAFPIGTVIEVFQAGTGAPTVSAGGGVTLNGGPLAPTAQYKSVFLRKRATDTWVVQ